MKRLATVPVTALLALALLACGGPDPDARSADDGSEAPDGGSETGAPESGGGGGGGSRRTRGGRGGAGDLELLASESVESEEQGGLHGEIRVGGTPPERFAIGARQKPECCTHEDVEHLSDRVVAKDGKLAYTYVAITRGFDANTVPSAPDEPAVLDQRGCIYTPHVMAVQSGRKLLVRNSDPTTHNVNVQAPKNNENGNMNMGQGQAPIEFVFERAEDKIRFKCDIHPWMLSYLFVADHPWFAVSDQNGRFRIPDVPPGKYTIEAIHEHYGKVRGDVVVEAGQSTGFAFTFE